MIDIRTRAIALYDAYAHDHHDRRAFMAQMVALAGSVAAAEILIAGIAPSEAAAQQIDPADKRLRTQKGVQTLPSGKKLRGYLAAPAGLKRKVGAVMVVHENRGLNAHIEDVARRVALGGFIAFAPDFLTEQGGTPADPDTARTLIGKADLASLVAQASEMVTKLKTVPGANGKVGIVGFCWGGAMVHRVAVSAGSALAAGASYYGTAPNPAEAPKVSAALAIHLAGNDARVNATGAPWGEALKAAGKPVDTYVYPGVEHAFNNDTSVERFNAEAAALAWDRTMALFKARLT